VFHRECPIPNPGAPPPLENPILPARTGLAWLLAMALTLLLPSFLQAAEGDRVVGDIAGDGIEGVVSMEETAAGVVLIEIVVEGLSSGPHAVHVHSTGRCEPENDFRTADTHVDGELQHGVRDPLGPHPGDLPNLHATQDGVAHAEYFTRGFTLGTEGDQRILDRDGSALVIHSGADDYASQPSGASGDRIACAVLRRAES